MTELRQRMLEDLRRLRTAGRGGETFHLVGDT